MGGESLFHDVIGDSAPRRMARRKFVIAASGAAALLLLPGLDAVALADQPLDGFEAMNVALDEGEILLDAATRGDQLWTLIQTPDGVVLRTPTGEAPPFPTGFHAESLGKSGGRIIAGGHRVSPLRQQFEEGNFAALVATTGLPGIASQPGLDRWPSDGAYEFETNELVPAYAVLSGGAWSSPIDVAGLGDVAGSVTSIIGNNNSLELVVDSLLDSSIRDSATEILQVVVSSGSLRSERTFIAATSHGNSSVLGQDNNKTYVLSSSLDEQQVLEVGAGTVKAVDLAPDLTPLSVSVEQGTAELFVDGGNGEVASVPIEEVVRRSGDIEDRLQEETLGKRSFGEDVTLAYEMETSS